MRAIEFITESKTVEFEGLTLKITKNGHELMVDALDDWGNKVLGHVTFNIGDGKELDPQDLKVDDKYQGQGIAKVMYDYVKSLGYTINRSWDQTDAGAGFWNKHRGEDVRVWEGEGGLGQVAGIGINGKQFNFSIKDLIAKAQNYPVKKLNPQLFVKQLADRHEDPKQTAARAQSADLQYPIIVVQDGNTLMIADGTHRAQKAIMNKLPAINAHVIPVKDMAEFSKQGVAEAFDNPYKTKTEKSEYGDIDMLAKLPDGTNLSIMFNNQGDDEWQVEFYRNNSQEVTGEGDAQRVFATVLTSMQKFIKKYKPWRLTFSANKDVQPGQNSESRAKLYNRLVQRYATAWGYEEYAEDHGDQITYELTKLKQGVAEGVNSYLWHGSKSEHNILYPQQANDTGGAKGSNKNAVYATPSAKVAIAMGLTTPGSDTGMFPNDPQMVLFKGGIRKGQMIYLHKVPKDLFIKHNSREWFSKPDVKEITPIEVVAVPVDKHLNLIRQATPADLELRKKYMKQEQVVAESEDKSKDPIANAILDFYQHAGHISKEPVDNYVGTAKEMLGQVSDPKIKSKILDIFKQAKQSPYVQGGVVTTIGALLAGGVLSSAQKMGLTPAQTNLALQAILNTVIPTVVSRINGKSWSDTIKYTLASAGIGTGIAGMMEE